MDEATNTGPWLIFFGGLYASLVVLLVVARLYRSFRREVIDRL